MPRALLTSLAALLILAPAAGAQSKIQPGAELRTKAGQCTLNFVYDGIGVNAGRVFIGTAAHCGDKVGDRAMDGGGDPFGSFAFLGNADETTHDYAFIEVDQQHLSRVDPAVKGHPEYPTGFTTPDETAVGDLIQMSGYGLGFGETQPTQEQRQTILQSDDEELFTLSGPSVNGDSGGPFVHVDTGKALGLVSQYGFSRAATDVGPTIQGVLAKAARAGFPVQLRAAGQPAPAAPPSPSSPPPSSQPAPAPAAQPAPATRGERPSAKRKKKSKLAACRKKAKRVKSAKKRKAARKSCDRRYKKSKRKKR